MKSHKGLLRLALRRLTFPLLRLFALFIIVLSFALDCSIILLTKLASFLAQP